MLTPIEEGKEVSVRIIGVRCKKDHKESGCQIELIELKGKEGKMMKRLVIVALLGIVLGVMAQTAIDWTSMKTVRDSVYKAAEGKEFKTKDGFDYRDWVLLPLDALVIWCNNGYGARCSFDGGVRLWVHGSLPGLLVTASALERTAALGWSAEKFLDFLSEYLAATNPWRLTGLREGANGNPAWVPFLTQEEYEAWVKSESGGK